MRCLQCGKAIPLFKRLGGSSEFCSDAHRKEYQREYSQLALGRLMQSHSSESQTLPVKALPLASIPAPAAEPPAGSAVNGTPVLNGAPAAPKPNATPAWAEMAPSAASSSATFTAAQPSGIPASQPPPIPVKKAVPLPAASQPSPVEAGASQPAIAKPAATAKPAPAELQFALVAAPEFEHAFASLAPDRPRRHADILLAELPASGAVAWESGVEIANSIARPMEYKLDLREVSRTTPTIALDLRIVPPESLETESRPLAIPIALAEPAEASVWTRPYFDFAGELASLSDFANDQFAKSDFEAPVLTAVFPEPQPEELNVEAPAPAAGPAVFAIETSEPPPLETHANLAESQTSAPTATPAPIGRIPDPELNPLPVNSVGIAPGRVKPLPVFGPVPLGAGTIQIPQPNGLPLRPVMVLATAAAPALAVKTGARKRKGSVFSLGSALSAPPSPSAAPNLPAQTPASRMHKILAALTGAAVLGAGIFFFLGKQSDAGLKSPKPALADGAQGGQWIADFAPDARRQRRVSLLRSSMNLSAYRLDFESSIHIKALGWVYRAQDARNFYVSKIEFQKPGQNPVYALVHYAVINGVEQPRVETPLHVTVPMGGLYKIRFEALGNHFTTWVQGQRVEQWTDSRLSSGGAGLYGEGVEQSALHGEFVVTPLAN